MVGLPEPDEYLCFVKQFDTETTRFSCAIPSILSLDEPIVDQLKLSPNKVVLVEPSTVGLCARNSDSEPECFKAHNLQGDKYYQLLENATVKQLVRNLNNQGLVLIVCDSDE